MMEYLYRYYDYYVDDIEKSVYYEKYPIVKKTPMGNWIMYRGTKRFVKTGTGKCLAHPSLSEAYESFKYRKKYQLRRLEWQYNNVKALVAGLDTLDYTKMPEVDEYLYFE